MIYKQLIEQCQQQHAKAQAELYKIFAPKLYGVCLKYCSNKSIADDLFQDAFITIFNKINQFKHKGSFEGWAKRITINTVLQHFKKQKFHQEINDNLITDENEEFEIEDENLNLNYLLELIKELPNQYRLVFNLYVLDGYSHAEISEALNISTGTSKSNLSRAKQLLRKRIESETVLKMKRA